MEGVVVRGGGNGWKTSQLREYHRGGKEKEKKGNERKK